MWHQKLISLSNPSCGPYNIHEPEAKKAYNLSTPTGALYATTGPAMATTFCFFTLAQPHSVTKVTLDCCYSINATESKSGYLSEQTLVPRRLCSAWPAINQKDFPCQAFAGESGTEVREEFAAHSHHLPNSQLFSFFRASLRPVHIFPLMIF